MSGLIYLLRLPILAPLAGVIGVLFLVWQLGPFLDLAGYNPLVDPRNRLIVSILVVLAFALYQLGKFLWNRRKNKKLTQDLAESKDAVTVQTEEEAAVLSNTFKQALQELKKAGIGKGKGGLYQLPWYIIIGPPGSGKTTALINSGLNFPLAKRLGTSKIQGVGGTRNCDWWFTDEAILLDTAGRYTTQDSQEQVDSAAWMNFLALLKKYRRQRPINGAIIAVSIADLLQQNEAERTAQALAIRKRIQELHEQFGIQFPIYVLFTKVDLIVGSMEFFDDLGSDERAQVWGMTLPLDDVQNDESEGVVDLFEPEFDLLEQRLNQRLLQRLHQEQDAQRRDLIYVFPQQFSTLKGMAKEFLDEIFRPNRFETRSLLRGVYFTSGTQEGNPIDRLMGALSSTFGVARQSLASFSGQGRSYFLNRLFREVMFKEAGLAGTNFRVERRRLWISRAAYVGVAAIALGLCLAWFNSYIQNRAFINDVEQRFNRLSEQTAALDPQDRDTVSVLALLDEARAIPGATGEPPRAPLTIRLGLYQGHKLAASAETTYRNLLERAFLSRLLVQLEEHIKDQLRRDTVDDNTLYEALRVYLMLDRGSGERPFEPEFMQSWWQRFWQADARLTTQQRNNLATHLAALLADMPVTLPLYPDTELVRLARERLPGDLGAEQIYQQLRQTGFGISDFRVSDAAGSGAAEVFYRVSGAPLTSGVPGLFSQPGQLIFVNAVNARIESLTEGDWVLDLPPVPQAELQQRSARVQELYWQDYCREWQRLLADLDLLPPRENLQGAINRLELLTGSNSPLRGVLMAVHEQTANLPQCLEALNQAIANGSLDELINQLEELAVQLEPLASARAQGRTIDRQAANELITLMERLPRDQPDTLVRWLNSVTGPIPIFLYEGLRAHINNVWQRDVLGFCQRALNNRYPFVTYARESVSLDDFGRFFAPGGIVDRFIHQGEHRFTTFVDQSKSPWEWRSFDDSPGIPRARLAALQFTTEIKDAFFERGQTRPSVSFQLRLRSMDQALERVVLNVDGQNLTYTPATTTPTPVLWPGPGTEGFARLQLFPAGRSPVDLTLQGPWALFQLIDEGRLIARGSSQFDLNFTIDGYAVSFELRASSANNPFRLNLENFRCLQTL